jgi:Caspase domain
VAAMRDVLLQPEIGGFTDIVTLMSPEPQQMREALERLFAGRKSDDLVMLYFSGHGVVDDFGKFHLTTARTNKGLLNSTAISSAFVHDLMEGSRSNQQVVILDCCFSGAFAKGMVAKGDVVNLQPQLGGRGRVVLTSSSAVEYSFEQKDSELSVYTQYLAEGLRTGIADSDGDGWITVDELHWFAREKVQEVAPAMQPKIYAIEEGYKIRLAQAPMAVAVEYRKEVERLAKERNGAISTILMRGLTERFRGKLADTEMSLIFDEVLQPYKEFKEKLKQFENAVEEFTALPLYEQYPDDLVYLQEALGLRNADVAAVYQKLRLEFSQVSSDFKEKLKQFEGAVEDFAASPSQVFTENSSPAITRSNFMVSDQLIQLQMNLTDLYEQLGGKQKALILAPEEEKVRIRQQIREVKVEIHKFEREYWTCLRSEASGLNMTESEAAAAMETIIQETEMLEATSLYSDDVKLLLQEILAKLKEPGTSAAGKLKAAIPLLPGFIAYEMELDTEGLLRRLFPTFSRLLGRKTP